MMMADKQYCILPGHAFVTSLRGALGAGEIVTAQDLMPVRPPPGKLLAGRFANENGEILVGAAAVVAWRAQALADCETTLEKRSQGKRPTVELVTGETKLTEDAKAAAKVAALTKAAEAAAAKAAEESATDAKAAEAAAAKAVEAKQQQGASRR